MDLRSQVFQRTALEVFFDGHPDGLFVYSLDGELIDCNEAVLRMTGATKEELRSRTFEPLSDPAYRSRRSEIFGAALAGETSSYTARVERKSGETYVVDVTNLPLRDEAGDVLGVMGIARDISQLERALDEADSGRAISRMAGRIAGFAGWKFDVEANELQWTDELIELIGVRRANLPRRIEEFAAFYDQSDLNRIQFALEQCIEHGAPLDLQCKLRDANGRIRDVRLQGETVRNDAGVVVRVDGALYDITSLVRQQDELRELEHRVATTLDQIEIPMAFVNRDWRVTFVNRAALTLTGRSIREFLSKPLWEIFPIPDDSVFASLYRAAMDEGRAGSVRAYTALFDRWFEATAYPGAEGIVISLRDVSSEVEAQKKIDEFTERVTFLAQMLDLAKDAMIVRDFEKGITYWNKAAEEMYGWTFEEVEHKLPSRILYDDPKVSDDMLEFVLRDGFWKGELVHRRRDGRQITVECRRQLITDSEGKPIGVFGVNTDITLALREKEQRVRTQRMESLGTLAGGVAHDLNNVLTPLLMSIEYLAKDEHDARRQTLLASMQASVNRGADMIRQVLSFARGVEGERERLSVPFLINEVYKFCRDTLPKTIEVSLDVDDDLMSVTGDATQLMQVIINLVTNARDAMPVGGRLSIRAFNSVVDEETLDSSSVSSPVDVVVIQVTDTGEGMESSVLSRVFEPFFTTKPFGDGTGLGLSTSLAIIKSHGGKIEVESTADVGTQFSVVLPATHSSEETVVPESLVEVSTARGEGRRVLIVDDEMLILTMLTNVLQSEGFHVDTADNGERALAKLASPGYRCDLIITDLSMPLLGGEQLVRSLRERSSSAPVIVMSGVHPGTTLNQFFEGGATPFLQKPFTTKALFDLVDATLAS